MSNGDEAFNFDRYRRLLAEANDESKRLAFIQLLIAEKARDRLAEHLIRTRLAAVAARTETPSPLALRLRMASASASASRRPR